MLTCSCCKQLKEKTKFSKHKYTKTGYQAQCKECKNGYNRTKQGLINCVYHRHIKNAPKYGFPKPAYSQKELYDWVIAQPSFHVLYNEWVKSNFKKFLTPTLVRVDINKGYSFDNFHLVSYSKSFQKPYADRITNNKRKYARAVNKLDLNGNFISQHYSINEATRSINKPKAASNIKNVCDGVRISAYGFKWEWVDK